MVFSIDVITVDSDSDEPAATTLPITDLYEIKCDCNSVNCDACVKHGDRMKIITMFKSYPITDVGDNKEIVSQIAKHLSISPNLIHKVILKFCKMIITHRINADDDSKLDDTKMYHLRRLTITPYKLNALEICALRREILGTKPVHIFKAFKNCFKHFQHKLRPIDLINTLTAHGLCWQRITHRVKNTQRLIMCENENIRIERIQFVREMQKYRKEGRHIIYIAELNPITSDDSAAKALIVSAANADGPIESVFMKKLTIRNFLKWISSYILGKLKEPAIIVMRAHTIFRKNKPTQTDIPDEIDSRQNMITWLHSQNIPCTTELFKSEMFELICKNNEENDQLPQLLIDRKIQQKGHQIMYIPANHSDLDPFELIWTTVKIKMMANGLKSFNMNKEFMNIKAEVWRKHFDRIVDIEKKYIEIERNFDRTNALYRIENDTDCNAEDYYDLCCMQSGDS